MKNAGLFGLIMCALVLAVSFAQKERVLRPDEVNVGVLVDMLSPEQAAAPESGQMKMRSFKVIRDDASSPARPAAASLLITFGTNSADLTASAKKSLDVVGLALQSDKLAEFKFNIEGHADPRGGEEHNLQLSQARAESVVAYLTEKHRIDPSRLQPVGKGPSELLNTVRVDAPENRRVTIKRLPQ